MHKESIAELIHRLQKPGIDMFEQRQHREAIARRGLQAIRELLPTISADPVLVEGVLLETARHLRDSQEREAVLSDLEHRLAPNNEPAVRKVCMRVLAELYPEATHVGQRLLDFVEAKSQETAELRLYALKAAGSLKPTRSLGQRFLSLLGSSEPEIVTECLRTLPSYAGIVASDEAVQMLETLLAPRTDLAIRCRAIELLGKLGEVDSLERVMLLPLTHTREHAAVQQMVHHLLHKPRSVTRLAPKNFEHLICRLLQKMKYDDVAVEKKTTWDEGVDVMAWYQEDRIKGRERLRMLGQCKRYQKSNLVGPDVVGRMVEALQAKEAGRGVIITTSGFLPNAAQRARMHRSIELIDGVQLQGLLDQHFSPGLYRVSE